jgi:UDP-N-acetylglucosamine 4,6-dehydratase/5-epimerase
MFSGKTLLITGGTGSFGNAVLDRFIDSDIGEIRIFSRDEKKQDSMRKKYNNPKVKFYLGTVRDLQSVKNAMHGVDYLFHAAALKQVPSCEFFPIEAVNTNVLGTENVLTAAIEEGVKKVVCLSTDKAAYPVNAMGISKAMMEKVYIAKSRTVSPDKTLICGVRYGNVMCSRGSVIPLFVEQIKSGGNITLTDPEMTRFIMSLDEAIDLILYAYRHAGQGDLMIQKSVSCYMSDLVQALREIFAADNKVDIIGTRHGEKVYEVLMTREESAKAIDLGGFFRIPADNRDLNYALFFEQGSDQITDAVEYTSNNTTILTIPEIKEKLLGLKDIRDELVVWRGR